MLDWVEEGIATQCQLFNWRLIWLRLARRNRRTLVLGCSSVPVLHPATMDPTLAAVAEVQVASYTSRSSSCIPSCSVHPSPDVRLRHSAVHQSHCSPALVSAPQQIDFLPVLERVDLKRRHIHRSSPLGWDSGSRRVLGARSALLADTYLKRG